MHFVLFAFKVRTLFNRQFVTMLKQVCALAKTLCHVPSLNWRVVSSATYNFNIRKSSSEDRVRHKVLAGNIVFSILWSRHEFSPVRCVCVRRDRMMLIKSGSQLLLFESWCWSWILMLIFPPIMILVNRDTYIFHKLFMFIKYSSNAYIRTVFDEHKKFVKSL